MRSSTPAAVIRLLAVALFLLAGAGVCSAGFSGLYPVVGSTGPGLQSGLSIFERLLPNAGRLFVALVGIMSLALGGPAERNS